MADDSLRVNVTEGMGEDVSDIDIPSVQGGLIAVTPDGILGWAWDSCNPSVPVLVTISAGGNTLGSGVADILDNEIVRQRVGVGIPAFLIKPITVPRSNYPIELDLIGESGRTLGSSLSVSGSQVLWDLLPADGSPYDGHVDAIQDGYLIGWAWDPNDPDREVILELFEGGELLGRAPASDYRADLADAGKRGGHCVFRFELPLSLFDDRCHSLTVRVANTQFQLPGKVLNFGPLGASGLLDELSFLRAEVARLRKLVERVSSPHGELQTTLVRLLSERVFAVLEVQRDAVERELDALRALAFEGPLGQARASSKLPEFPSKRKTPPPGDHVVGVADENAPKGGP